MVQQQSHRVCPQRIKRCEHWLRQQVDSKRLAGASLQISQFGNTVYRGVAGMADIEAGRPFGFDTIVRLYSMTKPVTAVAAMQLYEQGLFHLDEPLSTFIPEFADTPVWVGPPEPVTNTVSQNTPITIRDVMTHTAGFTYGFMCADAVDACYRDRELYFMGGDDSLESHTRRLADIPLAFQPGTRWNYSVASDVLGRLVEVWSGRSLQDYFNEHIFSPLKMTDTGFHVPTESLDRFAGLYGIVGSEGMASVNQRTGSIRRDSPGLERIDNLGGRDYTRPTQLPSGGGGLVGTLDDYARFCQMLVNRGELDGERLLGSKTVDFMRSNHLPAGRDMAAMGKPVWSETRTDGIGFGLGFAVIEDPVKAQMFASCGEYHWGGAASTCFWIDPAEQLYAVFLTQLLPSSTWPLRRELRSIVNQALC